MYVQLRLLHIYYYYSIHIVLYNYNRTERKEIKTFIIMSHKCLKNLIEISTVCKILMSTEISSNTLGNKQCKQVLHTTSSNKNNFTVRISPSVYFSYLFCSNPNTKKGSEEKSV